MAPTMVETRAFLRALNDSSSTSPRRVPPLFGQIAAKVARRADRDAVEELVQATVLDLVERSRKRQAGGIGELLALDDGHLHAALRRRCRQVAVAADGGRWKLLKVVRERVRAALAQSIALAEAPPLQITRRDRIDAKLLGQAVSWYRLQSENQGHDAKQISAWLLAEYFPGPTEANLTEDSDGYLAPLDDIETRLDAPQSAADLRAHLPDQEMVVLANRAKGATLKKIADSQECAVSTVHVRMQAAIRRIRAYVEQHGLTRENLEPVLHALA